MIARILYADLDDRHAVVSVLRGDPGGDGSGPLVALLDALGAQNIRSVTIHCEDAMSSSVYVGIAMSEGARGMDTFVTNDAYVPDDTPGDNAVWTNRRSGEMEAPRSTRPVYVIRLRDMDTALANVTRAVALLGACTGCGAQAPPLLRLACYELAANTVEHGQFDVEAEIRIGLRMGVGGVHLSYRDNSKAFSTEGKGGVNVGDKIARGERRGLGLFMLGQIAGSFEYERVEGWNVTTLFIPVKEPDENQRRKMMSAINIMITPCSAERTVVLRPVGVIDSATSNTLEAQIAELLKRDTIRIVVDMADVEFISSSGIGVFLGSVSDLRSRGGDLLFMNVPSHVNDVFDIVNLKAYFRVISGLHELQQTR